MFELRFFVDDSKLAKVLRSLDGIAYEVKTIPVREATVKYNKIVSTAPNGPPVDVVEQHLRQLHQSEINAKDIRAACKAGGLSELSYSYFVDKLVAARVLKKMSKRGHYKFLEVKK